MRNFTRARADLARLRASSSTSWPGGASTAPVDAGASSAIAVGGMNDGRRRDCGLSRIEVYRARAGCCGGGGERACVGWREALLRDGSESWRSDGGGHSG